MQVFFSMEDAKLGGGKGGGLPCPFLKIKKIALILEILSIFELNFPFKM